MCLCVCTVIPDSGARDKESLSFLLLKSEDGDDESWYWELLDCESESMYAGALLEYAMCPCGEHKA